MNDLEKALSCYQCVLDDVCFGQTFMEAAIKRIHELEKSNRNWRRKVQRLRKELKEVKHER